VNILFIGDVVGRPGREAAARLVPGLREEFALDLVVANGENAAGGKGATPDTLRDLRKAGIDAFTLGNHTWSKKELVAALDTLEDVVRPANYPPGTPGRGSAVVRTAGGEPVGLVNVVGRVYMDPVECPFESALREAEALRGETPVILVDMHAEATSEKVALGRFLDGHCSAVVGTHTHVQTADEQILPGGTGYITDVGMTGPFDSVIGVEVDAVVKKFRTALPQPFNVAKGRPGLCAVLLRIDGQTGQCTGIERVRREA
jgi:2',3'-cyclic-nucleotide 2'-phosphodiesterase